MDYLAAQTRLAKARDPYYGTPIANNTRLQESQEVSGAIGIKLHATEVVTILPPSRRKARYMLRTNGWTTVTTKDRINGAMPGFSGIHSIRGDWHVSTREEIAARGTWDENYNYIPSDLDPGEPCAFFEGIELDRDGFPFGAGLKRGRKFARQLADARRKHARELRQARYAAGKATREARKELVRLAQDWAKNRDLAIKVSPELVAYIEGHGLQVRKDGTVTMYKAVGDGWLSGHGADYTPGTILAAPDYNGKPQCGGGLHFWPKPNTRFAPDGELPRILMVRVPLASLVPIPDMTGKTKAQSCRVVRELSRHEYGAAGLMLTARKAAL